MIRKILLCIVAIILSGSFSFEGTQDKSARQVGMLILHTSKLEAPPAPALTQRLSLQLTEAEEKIGAKLNRPIHLYLYGSWEEKGRSVENIEVAQVLSGESAIHCLYCKDFDGTKEQLEYQILLRQQYGNAFSEPIGRAAAAAFSGIWEQRPVLEWIQFLTARNLTPELASLLQNPQKYSRYIFYPWVAFLLSVVEQEKGREAMIEVYRTGKLPPDFQSILATRLKSIEPYEFPVYKPPGFQKGMSYAYRNRPDSGYPTEKSNHSLTELQELGVNAIAILPYGFMRRVHSPVVRFVGHSIYTESDESLIAITMEARKRGMTLMMKPQIWISHAAWPGSIRMSNPAAWKQWFESYENWILHYAILSELLQIELFCIGTELVNASLEHPQEWLLLIEKIRQVYHGNLVYAANHGKEFEGITFWRALDYMGLDNYYSIRSSPGDDPEIMRGNFRRQKQMLRDLAMKHDRPIIFTEIGYMANRAAGMGHQERRHTEYDESAQALCYRLAMETYMEESWFRGMYWWKWFSDPDDRGRRADPHSPHGRKAEEIIRMFYK